MTNRLEADVKQNKLNFGMVGENASKHVLKHVEEVSEKLRLPHASRELEVMRLYLPQKGQRV